LPQLLQNAWLGCIGAPHLSQNIVAPKVDPFNYIAQRGVRTRGAKVPFLRSVLRFSWRIFRLQSVGKRKGRPATGQPLLFKGE